LQDASPGQFKWRPTFFIHFFRIYESLNVEMIAFLKCNIKGSWAEYFRYPKLKEIKIFFARILN